MQEEKDVTPADGLHEGKNFVPLTTVSEKVLAYYDKMKAISPLFSGEKQYLQFYIDQKSFRRMIQISEMDGFDAYGAFFGLGDGAENNKDLNQVTVCFVGVNSNKEILPSLKVKIKDDEQDYIQAVMGTAGLGNLSGGDDDWQPPPTGTPSPDNGSTSVSRMGPTEIEQNSNIFTLGSKREIIEKFFS